MPVNAYLAIAEACQIAIECCAGLAFAHEAGVVHRDLSPDNILLVPHASGFTPKILDFGIAKDASIPAAENGTTLTLTGIGLFLGKPKYASPEQAGGLPAGQMLDQRSDLYSFGIILYEMLSGDLPFRATTPYEYFLKHASEPPRALTRLAPGDVPADLEAILFRCLEKDREKRFPTARLLGEAIRACAPGPSASELSTSVTRRIVAAASRPASLGPWRRTWISVATGFGVVVIPGVILGIILLARSRGPVPAGDEAPEARPPGIDALVPSTPVAVTTVAPMARPAPAPREESIAVPVPIPSPPPAIRESREEPRPAPAARPAREPIRAAATPAPLPFRDEGEMLRAFEAASALEDEGRQDAAIRAWDVFISRRPSRDLAEKARWRATQLRLNRIGRAGN